MADESVRSGGGLRPAAPFVLSGWLRRGPDETKGVAFIKNIKKYLIIFFCVALIFTFSFSMFANASESISLSQLGSIIYAIAQDSGAIWNFTDGTAIGAQNFIENRINEYVGSSTLAEKFALDQARLIAGKLVVGQSLYNDIKTFLHTLFDGKSDGSVLSDGQIAGIELGEEIPEGGIIGGLEFEVVEEEVPGSSGTYRYGLRVLNGQTIVSSGYWRGVPISEGGTYDCVITGWSLYKNGSNGFLARYYYDLYNYKGKIGSYSNNTGPSFVFPDSSLTDVIKIYPSNYSETVINPGFEWEGTFTDVPDTNLDQLANGIYDKVGLNDLDLTGEVVEEQPIPTPVPTPYPVEPETPLSDVPWEGLNDLIGLTGAGINEQIQSQTQSITSAQEATTEAVESLTETITSALDTPDSGELPDFKFDLREFFPFCIPFDIYRLLTSFDAEPIAPHVQIPFVIQSLNFSYNIDLDFSVFDPVAQVLRTVEFIVYALGLAWATGKVIKW